MTSGMVRRGDRLLRPVGPWSPAVHEYLRYLEAAGFGGSPRVLGTQGNREVLTFIDGDVANDPSWEPGRGHRLPPHARTEAALRGAAELIGRLHWASAGFRPAITSYRFRPYPPKVGQIVSHGDLGPWNTVYRDGMPVAFIDWDAAGPIVPLADSPQPPGPSCHSRRPGNSPKRGSTRCLTCRPGCACLWTPMGWPIAKRSWQRCGAANETSPKRCTGSRALLPTLHAPYDATSRAPGGQAQDPEAWPSTESDVEPGRPCGQIADSARRFLVLAA